MACQLFMGCLEPYMTETFILSAFRKMGEHPLSVVMKSRVPGKQHSGYCFIQFATDQEAMFAMHRLNSKPIPNTKPMARFRLNNASNNKKSQADGNLSVWVGGLSHDVDDYYLYRVFTAKYNTVQAAKVILDPSGVSKGYGFVKFGSEDEMKDSLVRMNGYSGLGKNPIKISTVLTKPPEADKQFTTSNSTNTQNGANYNQYYDSSTQWQNYTSWESQGYYAQSDYQPQEDSTATTRTDITPEGEGLDLIEYTQPLDVDQMNKEKTEADCNLWDALESSKWLPLETIEAA